MDRKQFEMKYNFVPVFDTKVKKRRSLAPHLANDPRYMEKHGFILIEAPEAPPIPFIIDSSQVGHTSDGKVIDKPKRGRPKKQK